MSYVEWWAKHGGMSGVYSLADHAERHLSRIDRGALSRMAPADAYAVLERRYRGPLLAEAWARWWRYSRSRSQASCE